MQAEGGERKDKYSDNPSKDTQMTEENNILQFPKHKIVRSAMMEDTEAAKKIKEKKLTTFADSVTQEITENILQDFDNYGIDIDSDDFSKDFHFVVNVLTATIYRTVGLPHTLHSFIDERVKFYKVDPSEVDSISFDLDLKE